MVVEDGRSIEDIDELCRLALAARRLGCRVRLVDVDARLHDLIVLAGVAELLLDSEPIDRVLP